MGERVAELLAELNEKNIRIDDLQVPYNDHSNHIYSVFIFTRDTLIFDLVTKYTLECPRYFRSRK